MKYLGNLFWISIAIISVCVLDYGVGYISGMLECRELCEG